jgi:putative flippase GtrA
MKDLIKFLKLPIRGIPVGFIGELCDLLLLYLLGIYTDLDIVYKVYISQIIGILFTFLGNYIYTFKRTDSDGIRSAFYKYVITNVLFNIICSEITIEMIKYLNNNYNSFSYLPFYTNNKLTSLGNTIVKVFVDSGFYLIKIYAYQYILVKKNLN